MAKENWARWGVDDEIGALNLLATGKVRSALALVRTGKILSLAQPISEALATPPRRRRPAHFMDRDGGDYAGRSGRRTDFQYSDDTLMMPLHVGTHVDALCHVWYDDRLYNGFAGDTIHSGSGARHCGIDKMPPVLTRGILLDIAGLQGAPLADGVAVRQRDLEAALSASGLSLAPGDAVLIRTGWLERTSGRSDPSFDVEPGIDEEAALWLAEAGVVLVGADNFAIEVMPFAEGTVFPVHKRLIRDYGIPLLEGLVLKELSEAATAAFLFVMLPLPVTGGTASPVNPVAVL